MSRRACENGAINGAINNKRTENDMTTTTKMMMEQIEHDVAYAAGRVRDTLAELKRSVDAAVAAHDNNMAIATMTSSGDTMFAAAARHADTANREYTTKIRARDTLRIAIERATSEGREAAAPAHDDIATLDENYEKIEDGVLALRNALAVLMLDPNIGARIATLDPKAHAQATTALAAVGVTVPTIDRDDHDDDRDVELIVTDRGTILRAKDLSVVAPSKTISSDVATKCARHGVTPADNATVVIDWSCDADGRHYAYLGVMSTSYGNTPKWKVVIEQDARTWLIMVNSPLGFRDTVARGYTCNGLDDAKIAVAAALMTLALANPIPKNAVDVDTSAFVRAHGREPRAFGSWGFAIGCKDDDLDRITWIYESTYANAKNYAVARAAALGISHVIVCS